MKRMQIYIRTGEEDTGRTDSGIGFVIPFPCIRGKFNRILIFATRKMRQIRRQARRMRV